MRRASGLLIAITVAVGWLGAMSLMAAGGATVPSADPADQAAEAYNRGLANRDKAWELEEQARDSEDAKKRTKLEQKAQKEYAKAIRAFRSATEADPTMHQAFGSLGYALRKTGQYEESLAAYDLALELEPGYTEAVEYRAESYLGLDRLAEAQEAYMQLFREDRERADELMDAMRQWIETHRSDPGEVDPAVIDEFSLWVRDRAEISGDTASLLLDAEGDW